MGLSFALARGAASVAADALLALLTGGSLRIYGGIQPADPDVAIGSQVLLAELRFGTPAFLPAVDGYAIQASAVTGPGVANGTATWCRAFRADGTTAIWDGSVGLMDANVTLSTVSVMVGAVLTVTGLSYTQARRSE